MLRIITLLQQKNHYLEKFYSLNESELAKFICGNFDGIEDFYQTREKILSMVSYIDREIEQTQVQIQGKPTVDEKKLLLESMAIKDEYVNRILSQDLEVLECIETAKSNIIRELQGVQKSKRALNKFKSPTFQNRIDEKA